MPPSTATLPPPLHDEPPILARLHPPQPSLSAGVRGGARWMVGARVGSQVLQFIGVLITARLLHPSDYGKMAVVYPVIGFSVIFTNLGLNSAVIHRERLTQAILDTAFWLNAFSGVALTLLVSALSFPLAHLFHEPQLVPLLCLASLDFTLAIAVVHASLLERALRFRTVAVIESLGALFGLTTIVGGAALGWGAFALVLGPMTYTVVTVIGFFSVVRYRPHSGIDRTAARDLWEHARGVTGFQAVTFWTRNADTLLLAAVVSQAALGLYNRAYNLMRMPIDHTLALMGRVLYPALARLQHDRERMARAWLLALSMTVIVTAPVTLFLAVAAPSAIHVLLGERWLGMVPVLRLLALAGLPQVMTATAPGLLRATGDTQLLFRLSSVLGVLTVAAMCAGLPWGTVGVSTALLVKFSLDVPVVMHVCCRQAGVRWTELVTATRSALVACAALLAVGSCLQVTLAHLPPWQLLSVQAVGCAATYLGVLVLLDRDRVVATFAIARRKVTA